MPKRPLENLTESMFYVLMAFCTAECCGAEVVQFIAARTGGTLRLGPATLYTILAKFEEVGYITETAVEGRKRTYAITAAGREAYAAELERLRRCVADAEAAAALPYTAKPLLEGGAGHGKAALALDPLRGL